LRDAWFVGFTPELLTVVWVGFDDNQPVGLSGAKAARPIWTQFMKNALAGRAQRAVRGARRHHLRGSTPKPASSRGAVPKVITEASFREPSHEEVCVFTGKAGWGWWAG